MRWNAIDVPKAGAGKTGRRYPFVNYALQRVLLNSPAKCGCSGLSVPARSCRPGAAVEKTRISSEPHSRSRSECCPATIALR